MTLSPVSAISAMVAPVVLITIGALVGNGLLQTSVAVANRVYQLNRERLTR
jgi:fumarate reductase subunit D